MFKQASAFTALLIVFAGCKAEPVDQNGKQPDTNKQQPAGIQPAEKPAEKVAVDLLLNPSKANAKAPEKFKVKFETTKGSFVVEAVRSQSPRGVDRLYNMVKAGFFKDIAFFRVVPGFIVQFGIHGDPNVSSAWSQANIEDEPVATTNARGTLSFAKTSNPNTRTTQLFVNYKDNRNLDRLGFSPIARVVEGMEVVDSIYSGHGQRPSQPEIESIGNSYLKRNFPKLDYIKSATLQLQ